MRLVIVAAIWAISAAQANAGDAPTIGLLYHTSKWSYLKYECQLESDDQLLCDLNWSDVRKLSADKTLKEEVAAAIGSLKRMEPRKPKDCDKTERSLADMRNPSRASADIAREVRALDREDRRDLVRTWALAAELCRHPNRRTMTNWATWKFEQETRTCSVSSRHEFRRLWKVNDTTWASADGPRGLCGALWIARLERDPEAPTMWNYVERFSLESPQAATPDFKCADLKPHAERYEWGTKYFSVGCDYIKFGVF